MSTVPNRELVKHFKKSCPNVFYMPLWDETELEKLATCFAKQINWRYRFKILGGIPQYVIGVGKSEPIEILKVDCHGCDIREMFRMSGHYDCVSGDCYFHSLLHINSTPPYTKPTVAFASPTTLDMLVECQGPTLKHKIRYMSILYYAENQEHSAQLFKYLYEPYVLNMLEKGGSFTCLQLVNADEPRRPRETTLIITASPFGMHVVDKVTSDQIQNQLYIPKSKSISALDAWIPGVGAFQMTVGEKHEIRGGAMDDLKLLGEEANKLYWLVPASQMHSFAKKIPED